MVKKYFSAGLFLFILAGFALAIQLNTMSDGTSTGNLTFTGMQNISVNISLPKNALVTSAFVNLSGFGNGIDDYLRKWTSPGEGFNFSSTTYQFLDNVTGNFLSHCTSSFCQFTGSLPAYNTTAGDYTINFWANSSCTDASINITVTFFKSTASWSDFVSVSSFSMVPNSTVKSYSISGITDASHPYSIIYFSHGSPPGSDCYTYVDKADFNFPYPNNTFLEIGTPDGNHEWEITGIFNISNNKTSQLNSSLNSALNSGACDCTGCSLVGTNCSIPFLFHSDTAGIIQYSNILIDYTPAPFVTLTSPANNSQASKIKNLTCSQTDQTKLSNVTFYVWNSTGLYNNSVIVQIAGTSNSTTAEMVFNTTDTYEWNCYVGNNNSRYSFADSNFTLNVDLNNPAINLNSPEDNSFSSSSLIFFNYTPEHSTQTIGTCELWENSTGSFILNKSDSSITESAINQFNLTIADGIYKWNVKCNTTETGNSAFAISNFTLTIDTLFPNATINSITTTAGSQTISVNHTAQDLNLNKCFYSIHNSTGGIDGLSNNVSSTCNNLISATTTAYGIFNFTLYVNDSAGNLNITTQSFTTSAASSPGGGGGGTTSNLVPVIAIIQPENDFNTYTDLDRAKLYLVIDNFCADNLDFGKCVINDEQISKMAINLSDNYYISMTLSLLKLWIKQYENFEIESIDMEKANADTWGLVVKKVVIEGGEFKVSPAIFDPFPKLVFGTGLIEVITTTSNKKLQDCSILEGDMGFSCQVKDSTAVVYFEIQPNAEWTTDVLPVKLSYTDIEGNIAYQEGRVRIVRGTFVFWLYFLGVMGIILVAIIYRRKLSKFFNKISKKILKYFK